MPQLVQQEYSGLGSPQERIVVTAMLHDGQKDQTTWGSLQMLGTRINHHKSIG
jgi:hypothetical protein